MRYDEFLARVRDRGEYADQDEAAQTSRAVLEVLAERITAPEARDLAAQLPAPLGGTLTAASADRAASYGVEEFCLRVGERTPAHAHSPQWDVNAVLTSVADTVPAGELNQLIGRLPAGYAVFFGRAAPTGR